MPNNFRLSPNKNGTYDLLVMYSQYGQEYGQEFGLDFLSKEKFQQNYKSVSEFIEKNAKGLKISAIKFMVAGTIVASMPFSSLTTTALAASPKYSMSYLYFGTPQQQIQFVDRTNDSLDTVSPSYFDINIDGSLTINPVSRDLVNAMHAKGIKVVPFLSNHWDRAAGVNALTDTNSLAQKIAAAIEAYNLDGVNVDIENVTDAERDEYTELVRQLRELVPEGKEVSTAVAANPNGWATGWHGSYDYTNLAKYSDYLMLMAYDEHYEGGTAGPVASIGFVEGSIEYALSKTSPDKIVVGLPFFGRIWSTDGTSVKGKGLPIEQVNRMIEDYDAVVTFDEISQSPKAEFEVKAGDVLHSVGGRNLAPGKYVVWYEDDQSLEAKFNLINEYGLKGVGSWALGQEDTTIWQDYDNWLNGEGEEETEYFLHTVGPEDSLWNISIRYGTTVEAIMELNNLTSDMIIDGTQLKIPGVAPELPDGPSEPEAPVIEEDAWVVYGPGLNLFESADNSSSIISILEGGAAVTILGDAINNFYHIRLEGGQTGYIPVENITMQRPEAPEVPESPGQTETVVKTTTKKVSIRQNEAGGGKNLGNINKGVKVTVLSESGRYSLITYNGITGYVNTGDLA
ncbi:MAG: SH3 domain-containing protein [Clostridiales bacterium]|jgi:spore germination protein YaaH|nr:SH3 domain-containing protein [Clostridiales bacterium]